MKTLPLALAPLLLVACAACAACAASTPSEAAPPRPVDAGADAPPAVPLDLPTRSDIDDAVQPLLDRGYANTVVVGFVDATGQVAYGYGKTSGGSAADGDTVYEIGSVTKSFTSLWLATQVGTGLKLDDPVSASLPKGTVVPSLGGKPITLGQLSTHTSGLPRLPTNFAPADWEDPYADYTVADLYAFLGSYKLEVEPGSAYEYSNVGAGLLGHALTRHAGGGSYEANIARIIGAPLGLADTAKTLSAAQKARLAAGHDGDFNPAPAWNATNASEGAGMLHSTVNDLLKLVSAEVGLSGSSLSSAIALTQKEHAKDSFGRATGLGWVIDSRAELWNSGQTGGYTSIVMFDPTARRGVVILADTACLYTDYLGIALFDRLRGKRSTLKLPPSVTLSDAALDAFVGTYAFTDGPLVVTRAGHALSVAGLLRTPARLYPVSATTFDLRRTGGSISFSEKSATLSLAGSGPTSGPKQ